MTVVIKIEWQLAKKRYSIKTTTTKTNWVAISERIVHQISKKNCEKIAKKLMEIG